MEMKLISALLSAQVVSMNIIALVYKLFFSLSILEGDVAQMVERSLSM